MPGIMTIRTTLSQVLRKDQTPTRSCTMRMGKSTAALCRGGLAITIKGMARAPIPAKPPLDNPDRMTATTAHPIAHPS